jgi:hypothetical protein
MRDAQTEDAPTLVIGDHQAAVGRNEYVDRSSPALTPVELPT